jgi:hypothetical protein
MELFASGVLPYVRRELGAPTLAPAPIAAHA